ncbi:hypothetical protein YTPLAS73_14040 [Nitrosarchaeum sp.]|nr:hypothetical protein YTPLAS73_14040 [Nitrosarchaeum sp.]
MANYTTQVNIIHKKFTATLKKAKTRQAINKAYSVHRKDHERLLKSHLAEEMKQIKKAKAKLD